MIELHTETNLFGTEVSTGATIDRAMLAAGLYANLKDISLEEFVSYFTNPFEATVDYVNLCAGAKTGQRISMLFNPHRLDIPQKSRPNTLYTSLKRPDWCNNLARVVILNNEKTQDILYASIKIGVGGVGFLQEFPPHVARDLALEYNLTKASRVLDPCAGWGGRMIGFSTVVDSYVCCEPSTRTVAGLHRLSEWLRVFRSSFNATIYDQPFEDVTLPPASFDFALTSPPYYDTERYADEPTNSFKRYNTFDAWCRGFYEPLIHRTMAALKPGAVFVLNIGSRVYPLNERLHQIARDRYVVEKQKGRLSASHGLGKDGEGETFYEIRNLAGTKPEPVHSAPRRPSALDFVFRTEAPQAAASVALEPLPTAAQRVSDPPVLILEPFSAPAFAARLAGAGHRLLLRDGRFFVSEASRLNAEDRVTIKAHRGELIQLAEVWTPTPHESHSTDGDVQPRQAQPRQAQTAQVLKAETDRAATSKESTIDADRSLAIAGSPPADFLFVESRHVQTLAQFLGELPPARIDAGFVPDEPPDLTGVSEVVLNFATDGLDWVAGARPVGLTVSTMDGQLCRFLPFRFAGGNLDEAAVKRWATEQLRGKKVTNSKTKFDVHMAREWGVDLEAQGCTFSDVQHTAALLDDHRKRFALDALAADYFPGEHFAPRLDESRHHEHCASEVAAREKVTAQLVGRLHTAMQPELKRQELLDVQKLEDDVIPAVVEMEKNGSPIDLELLEQYHAEVNRKHDELLWEVAKACGFAFDHTAKGWQRLFESLGLPPTEGNDEATVTAIDHPTVKKAYLAAQYASLDSKTFKAYKEHVGSDGVLRFEVNQLRSDEGGTVSGRFSIGLVQQVPNHDNHFVIFGEELFPRRLFVPAREVVNGWQVRYLEADAAQIEFRLLVHYSGNARLLQAYRDDPWMSFHRQMQEMLKAYKPDMLYAHTKNYNFAAQYGARSIKLAVMMKFITEAEGDEIRRAKRWDDPRLKVIKEIEAAYERAHPEARALLDRAAHLAKPKCDEYCKPGDALHRQWPHRGYVKTLVGRRSRFASNYKTYIGLNRVLQGTGADIMKKKLAELHRERKHTGLLLRLTIHDAVGGDSCIPETKVRVSEVLNAQSYPLKVPILWTVNTGPNWAACK